MSTMKGVSYGGFDMQANGVRTVETPDLYNAPENNIQADALAERDGSLIVKQQFGSKSFTVNGYLRATSDAALESLMDTFKQAMAVKNQPFDIDHAGSVRRYLGSARNDIISRQGPSTAAFSVQFFSADGVGWDTSSSPLIAATSVTQSVASIPFTVGGTYKAEPYIKVTVNTITGGGTNKTMTLGNANSLRSISIVWTWAAGDVLEMDTLKGTLYVNGLVVPYSGSLLTFDPGANGLTYNDEFTTRDVTVVASYTRRWL